jgi:endo-1,4-beta-xylanase
MGGAQAHGMAVRGHNFVWHHGLPDWITAGGFSPDQLAAILKSHIQTVITHYNSAFPGVIRYWDVVNEAMGNNAVLRDNSPWKTIGTNPTDYIAQAFRWAHEAGPNLILFYNDFNIEEMNSKSNAVYSMLQALLAAGVPIQGIGFQMHFEDGTHLDWDSISRNFDRFAALGLVIHITELDDRLDLRQPDSPTTAQLQNQADTYARAASLCVSKPACQVLVTWGFTEKYSYIPQEQPGWGPGIRSGRGLSTQARVLGVAERARGRPPLKVLPHGTSSGAGSL